MDSILIVPPKQTLNERWSTWALALAVPSITDRNPVVGSNNVITSYGYAGGMDYRYSCARRQFDSDQIIFNDFSD